MIGKSVYLLAFLVSIVVVANAYVPSYGYHSSGFYAANNTNKSHNLIVGDRRPGDRLVLRQSIVKGSSWLQVVTVQQIFAVSKYEQITQVRALDQKTNGNGANVSLLNGGPGFSNVTLRFKSQKSHGINFVVEIYSRR